MYPTYGGYGFYGSYNLGLYGGLCTYGTLNLTESSPPQSFVEPLSLAEVKDFLRLPARSPADSLEDATISAFISGARAEAEIHQGRDLVRKQWDLSIDYWNDYRIELRPHLASVDLVRYKDSNGALYTMAENTDYIVDLSKNPGCITPPYPGPTNQTWPTFTPWPSSAVLIRFTAGLSPTAAWWADKGAIVKVGMRYVISQWFMQRLPFQAGSSLSDKYATSLLSYGALESVR